MQVMPGLAGTGSCPLCNSLCCDATGSSSKPLLQSSTRTSAGKERGRSTSEQQAYAARPPEQPTYLETTELAIAQHGVQGIPCLHDQRCYLVAEVLQRHYLPGHREKKEKESPCQPERHVHLRKGSLTRTQGAKGTKIRVSAPKHRGLIMQCSSDAVCKVASYSTHS
eukprot:scaffold169723_cov22-Tisochrysis_lutea.AAC.1